MLGVFFDRILGRVKQHFLFGRVLKFWRDGTILGGRSVSFYHLMSVFIFDRNDNLNDICGIGVLTRFHLTDLFLPRVPGVDFQQIVSHWELRIFNGDACVVSFVDGQICIQELRRATFQHGAVPIWLDRCLSFTYGLLPVLNVGW